MYEQRIAIIASRKIISEKVRQWMRRLICEMNPDETMVVTCGGGSPDTYADWLCQDVGVPVTQFWVVPPDGNSITEEEIKSARYNAALERNERAVNFATEVWCWWDAEPDMLIIDFLLRAKEQGKRVKFFTLEDKYKQQIKEVFGGKKNERRNNRRKRTT